MTRRGDGVEGSGDAEAYDEELAAVLERAAALAPPGRAEVAVALAHAAYRRTPAEQLAALDPQAAATAVVDALTFIDRRRPGELALRVRDVEEPAGTVVEVNVEDAPFLLSTVTEALSARGCRVRDLQHPVLGVERTEDERLAALVPARHARRRDAYLRVELADRLDDAEREELAEELRSVLGDALSATRDYPGMQQRLVAVAAEVRERAVARYPREDVEEAVGLLEWLAADHFIFLGYREYDVLLGGRPVVAVRQGSGLGILADESSSSYATPVPLEDVPERLRERIVGGPLLTVSRTNRVSTVHRRARMLYIGLKKVDEQGRVVGEHRFLGLFAQKAYAEPASSIPVLRRKLAEILEREDIVDHSYEERQLRTLFEALPKHELFQADTTDLQRSLVELLEAGQRQAVRVLWRPDPVRGNLSVLVGLPRERFTSGLRRRIQTLLAERVGAASVDYNLSLVEGGDVALLHFVLHLPAGSHVPSPAAAALEQIERSVRALARSWEEDLALALVAREGEQTGRRLAERWAPRFPTAYREQVDFDTAVWDVRELDRLSPEAPVRMRLHRAAGQPLLRFRLYRAGAGIELSAFLPILESLGFTVVEEMPLRLEGPENTGTVHLHDFGVRPDAAVHVRPQVDAERDGPRIAEAALAVWEGRAEADSLNRLVLAAGLDWSQVAILRAYRRYRRQVGTTFTETYLSDALVAHPDVARALVGYFAARFEPDGQVEAAEVRARQDVVDALAEVERFDEDRILRGYLGLIDATTRTNHWVVRGPDTGSRALALKLDSARVPDMPKPVPYVEVFVYAPDLEGVHLRGGPVARGGVRWSDRQEDVRTEVLGLLKAQMTKNSVIVPTGSKGGFVLKHRPADTPLLRAAVHEAYQTYVRALLDVTDNVVGGRCVAPARIRRHDGDDPYLVVAADRGTATFSDTANAISNAYGFWLGDAFASGGSRGYDHKAMGITARGAWVAVQRHFRELDVDVQREPVRVVGIGDMSGDVFGNGLLQSPAVKLVAAFDHRDVFVDPDPDPPVSYAERRRLFALTGSSWQDYDRSVLSRGGGVWARTVKAVPLSEEMRAMLRTDAQALSPPELIRALLRMPCDLLFAGGIGTFVKASSESHGDVGDRANDLIRVDADELGARVVGEGANLTLTQAARIQYARRGGRCNTDAIDNSAGVGTSDREVNIKILLGLASERSLLPTEKRDELLAAMTDDVGSGALRDVYLQTWVLSQEVGASPHWMQAYETLMQDLEFGEDVARHRGGVRLDRAVEVLPDSAEMQRRQDAGAGLTRPELAVLLAYAKIDFIGALLASKLPDDAALGVAFVDYFPPLLLDRFGELVQQHRLRRELVATVVGNDLVNRMGITYASRSRHELGCTDAELAAAYWVAREVAAADTRWRLVESLDGRVDPRVQLDLKSEVDVLVDSFTRAYLRQGVGGEIAALIDRDRPIFLELEAALHEVGSPGRQAQRRARVRAFVDRGIEPDVADEVASLRELALVPDVAAVARGARAPVLTVAAVFLGLAEQLALDDLAGRLAAITPAEHWERWHHRALVDELRALRRAAAARAVAEQPGRSGEEIVTSYLSGHAEARTRIRQLLDRLEREPEHGLHAVAVVTRALRDTLSL